MICPPEYNYDVHWPLGVYGTFVSVPCPRKANGKLQKQIYFQYQTFIPRTMMIQRIKKETSRRVLLFAQLTFSY